MKNGITKEQAVYFYKLALKSKDPILDIYDHICPQYESPVLAYIMGAVLDMVACWYLIGCILL